MKTDPVFRRQQILCGPDFFINGSQEWRRRSRDGGGREGIQKHQENQRFTASASVVCKCGNEYGGSLGPMVEERKLREMLIHRYILNKMETNLKMTCKIP